MRIGSVEIPGCVIAAPMAGVADAPFRQLACSMGASYAVGEMVSAKPELAGTAKSMLRMDMGFAGGIRSVQLAGADPQLMAMAARRAQECGAQIVDINMGCPMRKVCHADCGAFLMRNEPLAREIIRSTVEAVGIPVTVKMRTGWDSASTNAVALACIAEECGAAMVTVHGRTREQMYSGSAEYATVAEVVRAVSVPVAVNGDIDSPAKAARVLGETGAAAVMIGRAAIGRPWLFGQVRSYLETGSFAELPAGVLVARAMREHIALHYAFYGEERGVRTFRKHARAYLAQLPGTQGIIARVMAEETAAGQRALLGEFLDGLQAG